MREGQLNSTVDDIIRYQSAKGWNYIRLLRQAEGVVVKSFQKMLDISIILVYYNSVGNKKERNQMTTFFSTSMNHLSTTASGDKFLVSSTFAGSSANTEAESVANAIAAYEKAGLTADELMSIETVELEDFE